MREVLREERRLWKIVWNGFQHYERHGKTPDEAYHAFRALFVRTNGWFNDLFQAVYSLNKKYKQPVSVKNSLFKGVTDSEVDKAVKAIERNGYYVFPNRLDEATISALTRITLEAPAMLQVNSAAMAGAGGMMGMSAGSTPAKAIFDSNRLVATNYRFPDTAIINHSVVQRTICDPLILQVGQRYIQSRGILDCVQMWWTTPFQCAKPASSLAQLYHFDMDRIKFLNFFIYLTDVDTNHGPHCFVRGSHRRKPKTLRRDGRFSDEEIAAHYPPSDLIELNAPRGTLLAVDGRGYHKAKMPTGGNRLLLQVVVSNSLFGQNYERPNLVVKDPTLKAAIQNDPRICAGYDMSYESADRREPALSR